MLGLKLIHVCKRGLWWTALAKKRPLTSHDVIKNYTDVMDDKDNPIITQLSITLFYMVVLLFFASVQFIKQACWLGDR